MFRKYTYLNWVLLEIIACWCSLTLGARLQAALRCFCFAHLAFSLTHITRPRSGPTTTGSGNKDPNAPKSAIQLALEPYALQQGQEFEDASSYHSKALQWLEEHPSFNEGIENTDELVVYYALACVYFSTFAVRTEYTDYLYGAENEVFPWLRSRNWMDKDKHFCFWFGIICSDQGEGKDVLALNLANNRLTGSFPAEIQLLASTLRVLDLNNNVLYNNFAEGNDFLGKLTNLEQLLLGKTSFRNDGIPTVIGQLTKLRELDVSYTLYFGELDGSIFSKLSNLYYLYIGGNSFHSDIPIEIATLPNLTFFYAENADITGTLDFMTHMGEIRELWIDDNPALTGNIPSIVGQLEKLESFSVTSCSLTGPLPDFKTPSHMKQMWFYNNSLTGPIPPSYGQLYGLKRLYLQGNKLSGSLPQEACNNHFAGDLETLEADCEVCASSLADCCTCCSMSCIALEGDEN